MRVDLSHPLRTVVPSLDAFVLEVLAGTSRPLSAREVGRLVEQGSSSGVRLVLARLAIHGLATREERGSAIFYAANREHLAWPSILALLSLNQELAGRIRDLVGHWEIPPVTLALFGSAARRDGSADSDIDILLVEPTPDTAPDAWARQRDQLADSVEQWTGNDVQIYDIDEALLAGHIEQGEPIVAQWRKDARTIVGRDIGEQLRGVLR